MIRYFVRHPNAANLLMIAAIAAGLWVMAGFERESFPEFTSSKVNVSVVYPGASAIDVDNDVCVELDDSLASITGLEEMECQSTEGLATSTLTMAEGGDLAQFFNDILSATSGLSGLPDNAEDPTVSIATREEQIALITVSGIDGSDGLLRYADALAADLENLSNVSGASVDGVSEQEIKVNFDQAALRRYDLSANDISNALKERSLRQPLGTVKISDRELVLRYGDVRRSTSDLEELVIVQNLDGGIVRLKDIATITQRAANPEIKSFINGEPSVIIQVNKTKTDDAIEAFDQVAALLDDERAKYPAPFSITILNDSTETLREQINIVLTNAAMGLGLVFIIMCLFYSIRDSFWVSAALPVSFLAGFYVLSVMGVTINLITLTAMLMAVGLIMDDSIVIADNIARWRAKTDQVSAAQMGAAEVFPGVLSSFMTTACVFAPLIFLSGELGQVLRFIPFVLLVVLALSVVEAFVILPHHLSHSRMTAEDQKKRVAFRAVEALKDRFVIPIVQFLVAWRYATLGVTFSILIAAVSLITSGVVKVVGFPATEGNTIEARLSLTSGTLLSQTESTVNRLVEALDTINEEYAPKTDTGEDLVERVLVRYAANSDTKNNGSHTATIVVDLQSSETRNIKADAVLALWQAEAGPIADVSQSNFTQPSGGPGGSDLDVQLSSRDLPQLERATADLFSSLIARPDVMDAYRDFVGDQTQISLALNEFGYAIGLTPKALTDQLRTAFSGTETDNFFEGFTDLKILVELDDTVPTVSALQAFPISIPSGDFVTLESIATLEISKGYSQIKRQNGAAIASVVGRIDRSAITPTELSEIIERDYLPAIVEKYPGVTGSAGGSSEAEQVALTSMVTGLLLGLVGVYLILAFQFRSYSLPLVAMLSIPFAIIGVVLGHMAIGIELAMPSFIGFASLAGIVVNNTILFLTFFQEGARSGNHVEGVIEAVRNRFRPVLLSFSTTFAGLLPIVFETSPQAASIVPIVVAVAFGLLSSTLLVIFVFPSAIAIYFDFFSLEKWLAKREDISAEPAE